MASADMQYLDLVQNVLDYGYYDNNRTGTPAYKLFGQDFRFDLEHEFPILTTKKVNFKALADEIMWIWIKQSNNVNDLNSNIWNEWADEQGSIGRAYAYQVKKYGLMDRLINTLISNPQDRGMILSLWNYDDLPYMNLRPCAYSTEWDVSDGRLNCKLNQRSADLPLGAPFNMAQYALLVHMVAHVVGLKPGYLWHTMTNAHIYENQIDGIKEQLTRSPSPLTPKLVIKRQVSNIYDFKLDDFELVDYEPQAPIKFKVAV